MWEVCWFYNTSGSADVQYDLRLRFTNTGMRDGSGSVLSEVWTQSPLRLDAGYRHRHWQSAGVRRGCIPGRRVDA